MKDYLFLIFLYRERPIMNNLNECKAIWYPNDCFYTRKFLQTWLGAKSVGLILSQLLSEKRWVHNIPKGFYAKINVMNTIRIQNRIFDSSLVKLSRYINYHLLLSSMHTVCAKISILCHIKIKLNKLLLLLCMYVLI